MGIKHILDKNIQKQTHDLESHQIIAFVTNSDPMNNVCNIRFVENNLVRNKDNVPVRIYGDGMEWFPVEGETVIVSQGRNNMEIVSTGDNFSTDILPAFSFRMDRLSDFASGPVGSSCTGEV